MASGMNNDGSDGNMSDEESSPLNTDIYGGSQRTIQETKPWDVFRNPPPKVDSGSMANQRCFEITAKIMKVVAYLITFIIVLGSGVIAKGTLLFMTSQLREEKNITFCNKEHGREKQYQVIQLPIEERIAWMWCLIFAFMVPELGTLIRAMRICFFKSWKRPSFRHFLLVFLAETLHTIGLAILVFVILPDIDVVKGAMLTNCMCFVPAILGLFSKSKKDSRGKRYTKVIVDLIAIAAQATGFVVWPLIEQRERPHLWLIPVALIFISCGWWENYVSSDSPTGLMKNLAAVKESLKLTRYFTYIFISIWKIICFLCTTLVIILFKGENVGDFFVKMPTGFGKHTISVQEMKPLFGITNVPDISEMIPTGDNIDVDAEYNTTTYVLLIQILSAYFCYIFGKFACKIMIQGFSYAFPVNLTIPVSISLLIAACGLRNGDPCFFHGTIPDYLFFQSPPVYFLNDFISHQHAWVWLLWLLSQTWVTLHIWTPKCERLATTEKLFVSPMYDSLLIDQSMGLNRRRDDQAEVKSEELEEIVKDKDKEDDNYDSIYDTAVESPKIKPADKITRIFACATMWHETKDEMVEFLKSILRLDEDQCARRCAQKYLRIVDPDYYEFETHIFFDDAFEISDHSDNDNQVNRFVKDLVCTLDEAASEVHHTRIHMRAPTKYPTPYGGRLVWVLPGKTKMIAHLKDKGLIRHRKRWSQVMYMYYLLGHRLMELPLPINRKDIMAENTFLLTLDGDIDFQPHAVSLLIDLMKKNRNLGAACGRIHPVGSGPMVWYQMFEYAIGHWLQKATEHMIGCVLCSPGCFSLFRGKALMDDNVMAKYTTQSDQARHYVQYDQGEDRWLCTLLLQRGYRVEYSAASDAYTHCPEGFNEFYNQRRRWVPSTMANIMDLLMDSKETIKINDNISLPYIFYQILLMGGTILGPGTIFLMLVGAFVAAFHIDNWTSFYYNIIPILFFMLVCFTCKSSIQLLVAQILSTGYALVMMAVIVGTALQLREDGIGSPSAIFLITMTSTTFIAACLHPQEFWCVIPGIIYLLSIPSMYLLLILYSIINLNVVSWGTREVQTKKTKKELEEERKEAESLKKKKKQNSLLGFLQGGQGMSDDDEGSIEISFAGLFKCLLCTHQKGGEEKHQLMSIADSLDKLNKRLDAIERVLEPTGRRRTTSAGSRHDHRNGSSKDQTEADQNNYTDSDTASTVPREDRDLLTNPYWIEDSGLRNGAVEFLSENEISFWKDMLKKYLYPIDEDPIEKARIAADLIELRNKSVFAFFMFNALFVLVVFLLQLNKDQIHVNWPLGIKTNITYIEETAEVHISKEYLQLEPIGLVFVFFFALILVIQFTAMMFHRFGTLSHILASTDLNWNCTKNSEELTQDALMNKNGVEIARNLQRLDRINGDDDDNDSGSGPDRIGRRKTIQNLEKHAKRTRQIGTLDVAFKKRFYNLKANGANEGTPVLSRKLTMNQETMKALEVRRNSIMAAKRKSQMQTLGAHNEYGTTLNNNGYPGRNHRSSSISSREIFNQGHVNSAYEPTISEEETESRSSLRMVPRNSHVGFR